jgi:hypothetical protein
MMYNTFDSKANMGGHVSKIKLYVFILYELNEFKWRLKWRSHGKKIPTCAFFGVNDESLIDVKVLKVNIEFYVTLN